MTQKEFEAKLKSQQFKKVVSANGARGYNTTLDNGMDITIYAAPDMKAKKALDYAWDKMLRRLAQEWGFKGDVTVFR